VSAQERRIIGETRDELRSTYLGACCAFTRAKLGAGVVALTLYHSIATLEHNAERRVVGETSQSEGGGGQEWQGEEFGVHLDGQIV
jgi:hypothetical protein